MNEEEFDSSMNTRPFGTADALHWEAQLRRSVALGVALWGRTPDDLRRQLLAPHPEIPSGFDLDDFRTLEKSVRIATASGDPRFAWLPRSVLFSATILVGTQRFTMWEARCEVVRRAIEHLGGR
jgi:hypothetical protein